MHTHQLTMYTGRGIVNPPFDIVVACLNCGREWTHDLEELVDILLTFVGETAPDFLSALLEVSGEEQRSLLLSFFLVKERQDEEQSWVGNR